MNGSEKQVKWAEDIKAETARKIVTYRDHYQARYEQRGIATELINGLEQQAARRAARQAA